MAKGTLSDWGGGITDASISTADIADSTIVTLTCGTTNTSTTVTAASTTGMIVGAAVSGAGVPALATVVSIITNTSFVLSAAATATASVSLIFDSGVTSKKLAQNLSLTGDYVGIPTATTTQRDALTVAVGMLIYNSTLGMLQQYNAAGWTSIDAPPTITSFTYPGSATALDPAGVIVLTGSTTASGDATVTVSSTTNITPGMTITGTGIPSSTTIISITDSTHFELSANATATGSANVTLTINSATLVITGSNFSVGATVLIDNSAPTTVTRNSITQITVTGTPAKAAATYPAGLKVTNVSGLTASVDIVYDALPAWTTAAGSLGSFMDDGGSGGGGAYTNSGTVIRIVAAEGSDTIDYAQTNSAGVVNTDGVAGLVLGTTGANAGYLTGTLDGDESSTYNFYAKATDDEGQVGAVRLFNIISAAAASGGTLTTYTGFRVHTFLIGQTGTALTVNTSMNVDYIVVAGGGGSGNIAASGGGGAGGFRTGTGFAVTAQAYTITVGGGGAIDVNGGPSIFSTITSAGGGRGGPGRNDDGAAGGSGGGGTSTGAQNASGGAGNTPSTSPSQGNAGGIGDAGWGYASGGGGGAGEAGNVDQAAAAAGSPGAAAVGGSGGDGTNIVMGLSAADSTILLANASAGVVVGSYRYLAGGGGGGTYAGNAGPGGDGGGGLANVAGVAGSGGGGGGNNGPTASTGGVGGSGIVIVRYAV